MLLPVRFKARAASSYAPVQAWSLCGRLSLQRPPGEPPPRQVPTALSRAAIVDLTPQGSSPSEMEWAAAWLQEYRCNCRYLALLREEGADDGEIRDAWLSWWHAACACREALRRLDG